MTIFKSVMVATVLLAGGTSLALAQNGPATGGERPVAGGANGGGWGGGWYGRGWYGGAPVYRYGYGYGYGYRPYRHLYAYHRPYRHYRYRHY
jgi:hypothetical protein